MHNLISQLLIYGDLPESSLLAGFSQGFQDATNPALPPNLIISNLNTQIKRLLELATTYGFDKNLWQDYLTYFIITQENPFAITCEKKGATKGCSINLLAKADFDIFYQLFHYDFSEIEKQLNSKSFSIITKYKAIPKEKGNYNYHLSQRVRTLSDALKDAQNGEDFFQLVTTFYKDYGVGQLGLNRAFRITPTTKDLSLATITNMENITLDDLLGYEIQKRRLVENTEAFVYGRPANNVLLHGDSGTGKSTCIKALVNTYYPQGLRMIELYKHQFNHLSDIIGMIKQRNYRFIIYMDDLSFEEQETEYKFLKGIIEGGLESKPENVLIYATSNRRHLVKETHGDRKDIEIQDGVFKSDTMEEKLSLFNRFGVSIHFGKPNKREYHSIVQFLAQKSGIQMTEDKLFLEADRFEMRNGGLSGRTAQQFIQYVLGAKN